MWGKQMQLQSSSDMKHSFCHKRVKVNRETEHCHDSKVGIMDVSLRGHH